ncbi:MAG: chromate transporter [Oscillospiraceae bacterium]
MICLTLYLEFFKIGILAFGGGLTSIPFLQDLSVKYSWYTLQQLVDFIAISESTPGPIAINMATFAGFEAGGIMGSIAATAGIITPSIIIVSIIAKFLDKFRDSKSVNNILYGLRPCVLALISFAVLGLAKVTFFKAGVCPANFFSAIDLKAVGIFGVVLLLTNIKKLKKLHPIVFLSLGAALGILLHINLL